MDDPNRHPLLAVRPQLQAVRRAADALGLRPRELLHAGPPLADPRRPPATLASSVVMACLHEGWAATEAEAEALLRDGALTLSPAQDRRCVTPLAAVITVGTPLFEVADAAAGAGAGLIQSNSAPESTTAPDATAAVDRAVPAQAAAGSVACYAPVGTMRGADTRMGSRDPALRARLRHRDDVVAPSLQALLAARGPLPLWPLAAAGLAAGDDLHFSTAHANAALADALRAHGAAASLTDDVAATPMFFLTPWMAACALMLRAAEGQPPVTLVTRAGGNGERFAIALAGRPRHWSTVIATPPAGPRLPGVSPDLAIADAIGDSAVIDLLGLGGQRVARAPELLTVFRGHPAVAEDLLSAPADRLLMAPHPLLADGWPLGLDAAHVVEYHQPPRVMLAMLARDGHAGLVGRGVYRPPLALFEAAVAEVAGGGGAASGRAQVDAP